MNPPYKLVKRCGDCKYHYDGHGYAKHAEDAKNCYGAPSHMVLSIFTLPSAICTFPEAFEPLDRGEATLQKPDVELPKDG